ncbi:Mo-dependent nitrogenase C-terminal domain-containing protein [Pantanalinema rosaneae CENA516]|uniref:Mo-dependent nitrogenase C-terminal domain-containing protein n=1 Tax=Pantanalinema rosaneae TaxID=1620701 RepID=UPI003D6E5DB2
MTTIIHSATQTRLSILKGLPKVDPLQPLRQWLDRIEIRDRQLAHLICRVIPCECPFERDLQLWIWAWHIPPMCKLNPLYNELVYLRFRALSYLTDVCCEDITRYIC